MQVSAQGHMIDKHRSSTAGKPKKKKVITPYIRFCSEQRPYLKQKYPDATFIELGKMFGRMWNQLTDVQKAKYSVPSPAELAFEDEYDDGTGGHGSSGNSSSKKKKTKRKKVITPYIRFCSEQRPFLKQKYPDATFIELGKMFGRIWNQLTDAQKAKYSIPLPGELEAQQNAENSDDNSDEESEEVPKPKKAKVITPYIRFCSEQRPFLKQKYPDMAFTDMGKMFGRMWNQLTDAQKAKYAIPVDAMQQQGVPAGGQPLIPPQHLGVVPGMGGMPQLTPHQMAQMGLSMVPGYGPM